MNDLNIVLVLFLMIYFDIRLNQPVWLFQLYRRFDYLEISIKQYHLHLLQVDLVELIVHLHV